MRNIFKTISIITFAAFGAIFLFSSGARAGFGGAAAAISTRDAPNDLYARNCARCHGADGKGETEIGRSLDVPDLSVVGKRLSAAKISSVVARGKGEMPAYGKKLSKAQIAGISAYVRKL